MIVPSQVFAELAPEDHQPTLPELTKALLFALKQHAERPCFVQGGMQISYQQLQLYLLGFLVWLRKQGVSPGGAIAFLPASTSVKNPVPKISISCVVAGVAAMLAGYVLVPSNSVKASAVLWDESAPPDQSMLDKLTSLKLLPIPQNWFASVENDIRNTTILEVIREALPSKSLPCLMAMSSGTTGIPKTIPIMPDMMLKRALRLVRYEPRLAGARLCMQASSFTNHTILQVLTTLLAGGSFATKVSEANFHLLTPASFRELFDMGFYASGSGPDVYEHVKIVGSAINLPLLKKLRQVYRMIQVGYGSTEAGPTSACKIVEDKDLFHVGKPYPDIDVEIVDDTESKLLAGQEGYVRIRSHTLVAGYSGNPELTRKTIREGWFYPGDIGYYSSEGHLHIVGRDNEVINIDGLKVNAAVLDRILQSLPHTVDALAFVDASDETRPTIAALVELTAGTLPAEAVKAYESAFAQQKGLFPLRPRTYYFCTAIPRNANGKAMRTEAFQLAQQLTPVPTVA